MSRVTTTLSPPELFDRLLAVLSNPRFLAAQGPANDIPFYICPYRPQDAVPIAGMRDNLVKQLGDRGIIVLVVDIYDASIALLRDRGIWDEILSTEPDIKKDELKELLQNVLDPEVHLVPLIAAKMAKAPFDIMFLTGVGEVFPYLRSHSILNNLQSTAKDRPTVMFFPGRYTQGTDTGASLDLFGLLHDDKYYRATDISTYRVQGGS